MKSLPTDILCNKLKRMERGVRCDTLQETGGPYWADESPVNLHTRLMQVTAGRLGEQQTEKKKSMFWFCKYLCVQTHWTWIWNIFFASIMETMYKGIFKYDILGITLWTRNNCKNFGHKTFFFLFYFIFKQFQLSAISSLVQNQMTRNIFRYIKLYFIEM